MRRDPTLCDSLASDRTREQCRDVGPPGLSAFFYHWISARLCPPRRRRREIGEVGPEDCAPHRLSPCRLPGKCRRGHAGHQKARGDRGQDRPEKRRNHSGTPGRRHQGCRPRHHPGGPSGQETPPSAVGSSTLVGGTEQLGVASHPFVQRVNHLAAVKRGHQRHRRIERNLLLEQRSAGPGRVGGSGGRVLRTTWLVDSVASAVGPAPGRVRAYAPLLRRKLPLVACRYSTPMPNAACASPEGHQATGDQRRFIQVPLRKRPKSCTIGHSCRASERKIR